MHVFSLFAVPFAQLEMPDCVALNAELRALFLAREREGQRWSNPRPSMNIQPGLFESHFELFSWPEPCIQRLREFCWNALSTLIAQLNRYDDERMRAFEVKNHCWFHVTRRGGRFASHNHPMASWSGVYCVDAGRSDPDSPDSGVLYFENPHKLTNIFRDPANAHLQPGFSSDGLSLQLKPGQLVLFPSWLFHEVMPFHGEGERITVAFNCWAEAREGNVQRLSR